MTVTPISKVILYSGTGLNGYAEQMQFGTRAAQQTWFTKKIWHEYDNFQYVRHEGYIVIPEEYDNALHCDYMSFSNDNWGFKEFYAFVTHMEYVNDGATRIDFVIDCWQTWQFDVVFNKNFISKSHVVDVPFYQTNGNILPEGLEIGNEYLTKHQEFINLSRGAFLIASSIKLVNTNFGTTDAPLLQSATGGIFDKCPSALDYYLVDYSDSSTIRTFMNALSNYPWISQGIQSITYVPEALINVNKLDRVLLSGTTGVYIYQLQNVYVSETVSYTYQFTRGFGTGDLQKLYTYPYSFVEMTAYNGQSFVIKPQDVNNNSFTINIDMVIGARPRIVAWVSQYLYNGTLTIPKQGEYLNCGITFSDLPQFPILKDGYLLSVANSAYGREFEHQLVYENMLIADRMNTVNSAQTAINQLGNGNILGMANTALNYRKENYMIDVRTSQDTRRINQAVTNAQVIPPSINGASGGDTFNISQNVFGVTLKWKRIFPIYIERLNNYFARYGYTINKFDNLVWYLTGNKEVNFVQTTNCYLSGDIPKEDLHLLEQMFDNGVSMWHNEIGKWTNNPRST